jgi:hypothetical protein
MIINKCQLGGTCSNEATIFYEVYGRNYDLDKWVFAYVVKRCTHCDSHGHSEPWPIPHVRCTRAATSTSTWTSKCRTRA